jgi:hypothetical protein
MEQNYFNQVAGMVRKIVELLVAKDYAEIERISNGVRVPAMDIEKTICRYGRTLIEPPPEAFRNFDAFQLDETSDNLPAWAVSFDLWSKEEGLSDLTLELTIRFTESKEMAVEIDDLHVL